MTEPVDDEARDFLNVVAANPPPPAREVAIDVFRRAAYEALAVSGEAEAVDSVEDERVPGADGELGARRYSRPRPTACSSTSTAAASFAATS